MQRKIWVLGTVLAAGCAGTDVEDGDDTDGTDPPDVVEEVFAGVGYWLVEIGAVRITGSDTCTENYLEARCIEPDEVDPPEVVVTDSTSVSPGAAIAQVIEGRNGDMFLAFLDRLWPGSRSEGETPGLTFTWEGFTNTSHSEEAGSWMYSTETNQTSTTTIELTLDLEAGTASGSLTRELDSESSWSETDEGDVEERLRFGRNDQAAFTFLEGVPDVGDIRNNMGNDDTCEGDTCTITVTTGQTSTQGLTGSFVTGDDVEEIDELDGHAAGFQDD